MNNLKVRAAFFTAMVFVVFATVVATLILAKHYQGTIEMKYAVLAACFSWIAYVIYRVKLGELEDDDAKVREVIENIRHRVDCQ